MLESRYVPGALLLIGSPCAEVLKMTNCARLELPHVAGTSASARRGFVISAAGRPDAIDLRPSMPPPKSNPIKASRRFMVLSSHSNSDDRRRQARDDERRHERLRRRQRELRDRILV